MPESKTHYRLFLASPGDVAAERAAVVEVVDHYNLRNDRHLHIDVIRWEDHATPNCGRPQQVIFANTEFAKTDIFVGIFWARMGTPTGKIDPATGQEYLSGTMEEIMAGLALLKAGKLNLHRFMLYFCDRPVPQQELEQALQVKKFRQELDKTKIALYQTYTTIDNFKIKFKDDLETAIRSIPPREPVHDRKKSSLGPLVFKMCNRMRQVNEFIKFFRTRRKECPGRPQFYIIPGDEGQCHGSLIELLTETCIKDYAETTWGKEYGVSIIKKIPWPFSGNYEERKVDLRMNLIKGINESYAGTDDSVITLCHLATLTRYPLVIFEHNIYSSRWDKLIVPLLQYYLCDYWKKFPVNETPPQFLVFFNIEYQTRRHFAWKPVGKNVNIREQLKKLKENASEYCPCCLIEELGPVEIEDVKDWFKQNNICDLEWQQQEMIKQIFMEKGRQVNRKTMADIEKCLAAIINDLQQKEMAL